jgi:hypothetical protein
MAMVLAARAEPVSVEQAEQLITTQSSLQVIIT